MKQGFSGKLIAAVASVLLILALLIVSIEMFALNESFFKSEYDKLRTAERIGISEEGLTEVTQKLLAYTRGELPDLDMQQEIGGELQEVFGQREKDHMIDVRDLYLAARSVRTMAIVGVIVLVALLFVLMRSKAVPVLCRLFLIVSGGFLAGVAVIGIWAAVDFASFWTSFHHVFFTNDLWILDPRTDVLIMMVPEQFFSDLVTRIIIRFVSMFFALNGAAALGLFLYNKRIAMREGRA